MPIFDYECPNCGTTTESIRGIDVTRIKCKCGSWAKRIISASGVYCGNADDTTWARDALEVMDKDSSKPEVREYMRDPTKANLRKAMRAEGLRHIEPGEKPINRAPFDLGKHSEKVMERFRRGGRVEIHG